MNCQHAREDIATSLLSRSSLSASTAAHLAECAACRAEHERLAEVSGLLAAVDRRDLPAQDAPDDAFVDRLLREAARRRSSRRRSVLAAAAAAVLVLGGITGVVVAGREDPPPPVAERATAEQGGIRATVRATPAEAGTNLLIAVRGVPPGTDCVLRVRDVGGGEQQAARWQAAYDGTAKIVGVVPTPVDEIASVEVVDVEADRVLLAVPLA